MIPRFSNPHFLLQSTKVITRADLDVEDEEKSKDCLKEDSKNIEQLHRLLGNSLPKWDISDIRTNKRRKIEENDQVEEEPVRMCSFFFCFDKLQFMHSVSADIFYASSVASIFASSNTTASYVRNSIYVLLYNYNPFLSRTREPDAEDNELQADRRRKQAEAAAINVEDILSRIGSTQVYCFGLMLLGQDGDLT
jgi:hypothetical protein